MASLVDSSQEQEAYTAALALLSQLQPNRAVTSLFTSPPPAFKTKDSKPAFDMNSLAIPEMLAWLSRAGYTPKSIAASGLKCVHVAGTKGKGSVSAMIASILAQYPQDGNSPIGLYTSPHVLSVRERIALNNAPISREKFTQNFHSLWDRFTAAAQHPTNVKEDVVLPTTHPFYFRFLTILAIHTFLAENVHSAVVECGIGGEYDATTALFHQSPDVVTASVVTQLGIDHVSMLGDTVEKIAWHKAGVFRKGAKAFTRRLTGEKGEAVMRVLRERAKEKGTELVEVGDEEVERWEAVEGGRLQGPWQKGNMALAVYAAREHLMRMGVELGGGLGGGLGVGDIPEEFVRGLREAKLRGRCEVLVNGEVEGVEWDVDGAHTDDSLEGVGRWFKGRAGEGSVRVLVFNQQERDPEGLLRALLAGAKGEDGKGMFTHAIFTRNEEEPAGGESRDLSIQIKAEKTIREVEPATATAVCDSVQKTVAHVRNIAAQAKQEGKPCQVLVTGSFHLVGALLKTIAPFES